MAARTAFPYVCARCISTSLRANPATSTISSRKSYATKPASRDDKSTTANEARDAVNRHDDSAAHTNAPPEPGPMSRRLQEATEEALFTGGTAGRRAVEDAGFSEELKERLLAKVQDAQFRSQHASAFSQANMPSSAGTGTRITAASQPWTGEESTEDAVLRMLTDAHKPLSRELRGRPKISELTPVDMRMRQQTKLNPSHRAATARDRASMYAGLGIKESESSLNEKERAARREEFRERFQPGARALPNTVAGLTALANQRIEDAIARGQFKNIPRGKEAAPRDTRSDNPFIDTTEYILNNMIKRQDIVPPWIEKQQELAKAAHTFRGRLRNDWKRHAARTIASKGGTLEAQMERAAQYAKAERIHNPRRGDVDKMAIPTNATEDVVMVKIRQQVDPNAPSTDAPQTAGGDTVESGAHLWQPFRDPDWLTAEQSYMQLSVNNLNTLTRSYNLMAPELAKKPYFNLERELNNCYADVAPLLADTIRDRATRPPKSPVENLGESSRSILDRFGNQGPSAKIHESKAPRYGLKEFWRDLFQ